MPYPCAAIYSFAMAMYSMLALTFGKQSFNNRSINYSATRHLVKSLTCTKFGD